MLGRNRPWMRSRFSSEIRSIRSNVCLNRSNVRESFKRFDHSMVSFDQWSKSFICQDSTVCVWFLCLVWCICPIQESAFDGFIWFGRCYLLDLCVWFFDSLHLFDLFDGKIHLFDGKIHLFRSMNCSFQMICSFFKWWGKQWRHARHQHRIRGRHSNEAQISPNSQRGSKAESEKSNDLVHQAKFQNKCLRFHSNWLVVWFERWKIQIKWFACSFAKIWRFKAKLAKFEQKERFCSNFCFFV